MSSHIVRLRLLVLVLAGAASSHLAAAERELAYFGEHLIVAPGSAMAQQLRKEYPGRPKRKPAATVAPVPQLGNFSIALGQSASVMPAVSTEPPRADFCGKRSEESLTVCLETDGRLPASDEAAAIQFLKSPTLALVATDVGRRTVETLVASTPEIGGQTEIRALDAAVCAGDCATRIRLLRK